MLTCLPVLPAKLFALLVVVLFFDPPVAGQATSDALPTGQTGATDGQSAVEKPAVEPFADVFAQWKGILGQLRDLQKRYKEAQGSDRRDIFSGPSQSRAQQMAGKGVQPSELEAMRAAFDRLLQQGEDLMPRLRASAIAAYRAAPNSDPELSDFLIKSVEDDLLTDHYESALELAQVLIEADSKEPKLLDLAGRGAFAQNDFEMAQKYLAAARDAGNLSSFGKADLENVDEYQRLWRQEQEIRRVVPRRHIGRRPDEADALADSER